MPRRWTVAGRVGTGSENITNFDLSIVHAKTQSAALYSLLTLIPKAKSPNTAKTKD